MTSATRRSLLPSGADDGGGVPAYYVPRIRLPLRPTNKHQLVLSKNLKRTRPSLPPIVPSVVG